MSVSLFIYFSGNRTETFQYRLNQFKLTELLEVTIRSRAAAAREENSGFLGFPESHVQVSTGKTLSPMFRVFHASSASIGVCMMYSKLVWTQMPPFPYECVGNVACREKAL